VSDHDDLDWRAYSWGSLLSVLAMTLGIIAIAGTADGSIESIRDSPVHAVKLPFE
jgi:hypothetical protein